MDILLAVNSAFSLLSKLKEVSEKSKDAELKNIIADLVNELADVKLAAADLKEQVIIFKTRIAELEHQRESDEKPEIKWGCYYFDGDESRLYCTACYDTKRLKSLTNRITSGRRACPVCKAVIGTG